MIRAIKRIGFTGMAAMNIDWLKKKSPLDVISPFHHLVSDVRVPHIEKLYPFKNSAEFEADLDFFLRNFHPYTLQEIISHIREGRPFEKKGFLLHFDDGLREVYEVAAPILLRKGVPAALFVNEAFVDNREIFYNFKKGLLLDKLDTMTVGKAQLQEAAALIGAAGSSGQGQVSEHGRESKPGHESKQRQGAPTRIETVQHLRTAIRGINYLSRQLADPLCALFGVDLEAFRTHVRPFMTTPEIKDLIGKGFAVGSHSIDHPLYRLLPPAEQLRQTRQSTDWVVRQFGLPYKAFAFPHVDTGVGNAFFQALVDPAAPEMDLLFGNATGMMERNPRVLHRFIGENPYIPIDQMVKSVLAYSAIRKQMGRPYVQRD